jgi:hypothetical protein
MLLLVLWQLLHTAYVHGQHGCLGLHQVCL